MTLESKVIAILKKSPADQYYLYHRIGNAKISEITKVIAKLQERKIIYVTKHRKNCRTGLRIPIYSLSVKSPERKRLDIDSLLAGVTSERIVEYTFLKGNLVSRDIRERILDIGCAESTLTKTISEFGDKKWQVTGIDVAKIGEKSDLLSLARMDARAMGFRNEVFNQVICISTIEHIGVPSKNYNIRKSDEHGDTSTISEIYRVLKKSGTVILTLPYGNRIKRQEHRIYNNFSITNLTSAFSIIKKEFYGYEKGKWKRCNTQSTADKIIINKKNIPSHFHSPVCVCLLLKKDLFS